MADKKLACVLTMVKDDYFFLDRWVKYYGGIFGREALYVVSHGADPRVAEIAEGCSVITLPGDFREDFDVMRWRLFNGFAAGLRGYHDFVIITDVDEFVVMDPKTGMRLDDFLKKRRGKVTATPVGLEVVHQPALEPDAIGDGPMLGPRRYARFTTAYSKPIIFNHEVKLSRGGHYTTDPELKVFRNLYLFHMRYVDAALYDETLARRKGQVEALDNPEASQISWQWQGKQAGGRPYDELVGLPVQDDFEFGTFVDRMNESWAPRDESGGLYHVKREISKELKTIPERFFGLV